MDKNVYSRGVCFLGSPVESSVVYPSMAVNESSSFGLQQVKLAGNVVYIFKLIQRGGWLYDELTQGRMI